MNSPDASEIDLKRLSALVKTKRAGRTYREAAADAGVAPATLLRAERQETIDLERFARICRWLGIKPEVVFTRPISGYVPNDQDFAFTSSLKTPEKIDAVLRFEGKMKEEEIAAVTNLVKMAYERAEPTSKRKKR
jgi:transcriptional regulator with XRE-family HTH domain